MTRTICEKFLTQLFSKEDFGISVAILFGGANSNETFTKCCDLACDVELPLLKNCKNLTMTLVSFYNFTFRLIFFSLSVAEGLGMRKTLAYGIRMQKNPYMRTNIFWIFMELCGSKVQLAAPHGNFINGVAKPEIIYVSFTSCFNFQFYSF